MSPEQIEESAALHAMGALAGEERAEFERLLESGDALACRALREFRDAAALYAAAQLPAATPSSGLKAKILDAIQRRTGQSTAGDAMAGFHFVPEDSSRGWLPMRVPGAFIKLLSFNREQGYAVVLGRLDPGAHYPAHHHSGAEELYLLSGDLRIGERTLRAGDFHHSDPGTFHEDNRSEQGCTLLAVVSSREVLQELGLVAG
jgi:quercetin dioxygenase-like cupin family protein